ncbi:MAG: hypothetical protein IKQ97_00160, partial [Eubacterium sp.]|nr:hypothetical protein [Eubacterium sp.]
CFPLCPSSVFHPGPLKTVDQTAEITLQLHSSSRTRANLTLFSTPARSKQWIKLQKSPFNSTLPTGPRQI